VIYYATPSGSAVRDLMGEGRLGCIVAPKGPRQLPPEWDSIADNGCFGGSWTEEAWLSWLSGVTGSVRFATAPDVVDLSGAPTHAPTLRRWEKYAPTIEALGFTPAFVCQVGATWRTIPTDAEVLFLGGTTDWKLGDDAARIAKDAKSRNVWVHMGRVNSKRRFDIARTMLCDSVDGTYLTYGPDANLPKLLAWIADSEIRPMLWEVDR